MSTAKLHWSKTGKGENARYTLEGYEGVLPLTDLPTTYLLEVPLFYVKGGEVFMKSSQGHVYYLSRGVTFHEKMFRFIISQMKSAGRRLTEINKKLREPVRFTVEI